MKIKKFKSKQILKLSLLKSRGYENNIMSEKTNSNALTQINLTKALKNFKKVLQIIFKYHRSEKKILFVGFPKKLQSKINSFTGHVAVPENFDLQHFFSNNNLKALNPKKSVKLHLMKTLTQDFSFKLAKKPDLLVLVSKGKIENTISESYTYKLPMILFGTKNSKSIWIANSYRVNGINKSLFESLNQDLFFMGFNFLFKAFNRKALMNTGVRKFSYNNKR